jgi:hypothetical protein
LEENCHTHSHRVWHNEAMYVHIQCICIFVSIIKQNRRKYIYYKHLIAYLCKNAEVYNFIMLILDFKCTVCDCVTTIYNQCILYWHKQRLQTTDDHRWKCLLLLRPWPTLSRHQKQRRRCLIAIFMNLITIRCLIFLWDSSFMTCLVLMTQHWRNTVTSRWNKNVMWARISFFSLNIFYLLKCAKRIRHKLNKLMKSSPIYNKLQHYLIEHACI